jgi:hypothetical protein
MKNRVVEYTKDFTTEEGVIIPTEAFKSVVRNHTKRYHNCLYLLAGLNTCARNLMDFLTEEMKSDNVVYSSSHTRDKFKDFINVVSKGEVNYSDSSIKKAFSNLSDKGLVRKVSRGIYKVNPEYFIKNDESKRFDLIKIELEFKEGLNTKLEIIKKETE